MFKTACIQLCAGRSVDRNVEAAERLIRDAAEAGADLVVTPEMTSLMELGGDPLFNQIADQNDDRALARFRIVARELERWILIGSLAVRVAPDKAANRAFLIGPDGSVVATYDKMHMFDVSLAGGETYRESRTYRPGDEAVTATLPWGTIGLTVCYDLRFPALYRSLSKAGAAFIAVPSAFTQQTGTAHWHTLLRARAIENGVYIFAPAQTGEHENGRKTYGHSLIVSPWGEVLADGGTETGYVIAEIDPEQVSNARRRVPALDHDRQFELSGSVNVPSGLREAS